jgi:manganese/zinc/iron transport system permease protein
MLAAINPYKGVGVIEFFTTLFSRLGALCFGGAAPVSDELQVMALVFLSVSASLIGSMLVFKKMAMMANALCHTILLGIALALLTLRFFTGQVSFSQSLSSLPVILLGALVAALATSFFTELLTHKFKVQEDASIGLIFSTFFAAGIVLVTVYFKNAHIGAEAVMGSIDALCISDVKMIGYLAILNAVIFLAFFRSFLLAAFDPSYAGAVGLRVSFVNHFLMCITAATSIAAFKAVGVLLVLSFFVAPTIIARFFSDRFHKIIIISFVFAAVISLLSVATTRAVLSYYGAALSTAGVAVTLFFVCYLTLALFSKAKDRKIKIRPL